MNTITTHTFDVSDALALDVRSVLIEGEPWFIAKDVCDALRYTNSRKALADHVDPEDVTKRDTLTNGGMQAVSYINESGLYDLIMGSKLDSAKQFKRWVTKVVLPSIRKHGAYITGMEELPELAQAEIAEAAKREVRVREVRIAGVCHAKAGYTRAEWRDIGLAYSAAIAVAPVADGHGDEFEYGVSLLRFYKAFARQLTLYKVRFKAHYMHEAMAHFNDAFRINQEFKAALKKHKAAYSSW